VNLTGKQKNFLRGLAHHRNPVVTIGNAGLSTHVLTEIELALVRHELLKLKLPAGNKQERTALLASICAETLAEPVQIIGRVGVIYRKAKEPVIIFP
jgi:RNA-binding protein